MFQQILVPVDGSTPAEQSIPWAARIARASGASVVLLRVVTSPSATSLYEGETAASPSEDRDDIVRAQALRYLQTVMHRQELADLDVLPLVANGPLAADEILAAARTLGADLIVLSTHLHTDRTRWLQASVAQNVIRLANSPVFVVHERALSAADAATATLPPDHVRTLVTLDGSRYAEGALWPAVDIALALAGAQHAELHLLRVIEIVGRTSNAEPQPPAPGRAAEAAGREAEWEDASAYLAALVARLRDDPRAARVGLTWSVASDFDTVDAILREAGARADANCESRKDTPQEAQRCGVVAMTTHGVGGIRPWSLGSTTDRVLHSSAAPLLVASPLAP